MTADLEPTADRFRALARSSPWRWNSIEFEWTTQPLVEPSHAWIRRPNYLRVERPDGKIDLETRREASKVVFYTSDGGRDTRGLWPTEVQPALDEDGLVSALPSDLRIDYDAPYYENYHWVAMLTPFEFAVGIDDTDSPVLFTDVTLVDHYGRPTWQALAHPTAAYDPRCDCCSLLTGTFDDSNQEWQPDVASTVRLDAATGICVYTEHHWETSQVHLDIRIIDVDAPLVDELFFSPKKRWWNRR